MFVDENLYNCHRSECPVIAERNLNLHKIKDTFLDYSQDCKGRNVSKDIPKDVSKETGVEANQVCDDDSGDESDLELTVNKEAWILHVPKQSLECKKFREKIPCLGCGKSYPGTKINEKVIQDGSEVEQETIIGRRDFYNHCIFKCPKYQNLNLTSLCLRCNKFYLDPDEFVTHKLSSCNVEEPKEPKVEPAEEPKKRKTCPRCSKSFSGLKSIKQHITRSHDLSEIDAKVLELLKMDSRIVCELCQKVFFSIIGLRNHKRAHFVPVVPDSDLQPSTSSSVVKIEEELEDNDEKSAEKVQQEESETIENLNERSEKHQAEKCGNVGPIIPVVKQLPSCVAGEKKGLRLNHGCDLCTKSFGDKRRLALHKRSHRKKSESAESCTRCTRNELVETAIRSSFGSTASSSPTSAETETDAGQSVEDKPAEDRTEVSKEETEETKKKTEETKERTADEKEKTENEKEKTDVTKEKTGETETESKLSFSIAEMEAIVDYLCAITIHPSILSVSEDSNQCSICLSTLENSFSLRIHFLKRHCDNEVDCPNCDISLQTMSSLYTHFVESHEMEARRVAKKVGAKRGRKRAQRTRSLLADKKAKTESASAGKESQSNPAI